MIRQQNIYNPIWKEYRGVDIALDEHQRTHPVIVLQNGASNYFHNLDEAKAYIDENIDALMAAKA